MAGRTFDPTEQLGVNAVAMAVGKMGFIWREQPVADFGIDGHIELVDNEKKPTGQLVGVQIKSGKSFFAKMTDRSVPFYIPEAHWDYWSTHALPIIVVLHDEASERTVWEWVIPETTIETGKMRRLDIPLWNTFEAKNKERLRDRGPVNSAAARRQRFVMDIGIMRALRDEDDAYISFKMWINKSLSFRGAEIRFGDPHKQQADLEFPWMSTYSDVAEIAWALFPWLSLDEYYSLENHSGEVDEHIIQCSLSVAARAFLTVQEFFEQDPEVPQLPDPPKEDDSSFDRWHDDDDG